MRSIVTLTVTTPSVVRSTPWISLIGGTSSVPLPGSVCTFTPRYAATALAVVPPQTTCLPSLPKNRRIVLRSSSLRSGGPIMTLTGQRSRRRATTTVVSSCMASMSRVLTVERMLAAMRCEETLDE